MIPKPLGQVKELVESLGMEVSYAYDDLVFLEHTAFLLQFDDGSGAGQAAEDRQLMIVHTNSAATEQEMKPVIARLVKAAPRFGLTINRGNKYSLAQAGDETVAIEFHA